MALGIASRMAASGILGLGAVSAFAYGGGYHYGPGMMYGGGWGGGIFGWLMMLLVVVLVVALVVGALRWLFGAGHRPASAVPAPRKAALEILEERYARGEIDKEEFEEKRSVLSR